MKAGLKARLFSFTMASGFASGRCAKARKHSGFLLSDAALKPLPRLTWTWDCCLSLI
jgi:hypothetical protein